MDEAAARQALTDARFAVLGTVAVRGHPHLVPCCFAVQGDIIYSAVDAKPKSTLALRRLDNLRANPAATLLVHHDDEDWSALWWVRVDGTGRIVGNDLEQTGALGLLTAKYPQYRESPPAGDVIAVDVQRWRWWTPNGSGRAEATSSLA